MEILRRIPPRFRKWLYDVAAAALFIYGLWRAAHGDWEQFAVSLVTAVGSQLASANVDLDALPGPVDLGLQDAEATEV